MQTPPQEEQPIGTRDRRLVLIVDDDPHIREIVRFALDKAGLASAEAADGQQALDLAARLEPDLVILDILMPEMDGSEVCRRLRSGALGRTPIIFLSSKSDEIDRVLGLELGGDDYVTKPFSPRELVARVRAVLRRADQPPAAALSAADPDSVLTHGPLRLDVERFEASWRGRSVPLTVTEFGLLRALMGRPGKVFTRDELMQLAYRDHVVVSDRTINSHIKRLRRKLATVGGEPVETVHGLGYRLGPG
ncbi:MAG: response regulator transcription factor [Acidobacteriota bacterium]